MAVTNFIPTIWEARLLAKFHEKSIASAITVAPEEIKGNKIIFNNVSDVAVKDYEGTVAWDDLTTPKVELDMDIEKYWAFKVDDVDAVQAAGALIDPHVEEASASMSDAMDRAVLTEGMKTLNAIQLTAEKAYDAIVKSNTALNKKKVPKTNRFAVINSEVLEELNLDDRFTNHYKILENGVIEGGDINGTTLVFSEELNDGAYAILTLHKSAIGFGTQLQKTEAMRLEGSFSDGVRGLSVAGTKILRPSAVVKATKAV